MGGCSCRPQTEVTEDSSVYIYTDVGCSVLLGVGSAKLDFNSRKSLATNKYSISLYTLSYDSGQIYVKDGNLYHEATVGSRFCCKCAKHCWRLSDIKHIEVVNGQYYRHGRIYFSSNGYHRFNMRPGLRVIFQNDTSLVMAVPDAEYFCLRMRQYFNARPTPATGGDALGSTATRLGPMSRAMAQSNPAATTAKKNLPRNKDN